MIILSFQVNKHIIFDLILFLIDLYEQDYLSIQGSFYSFTFHFLFRKMDEFDYRSLNFDIQQYNLGFEGFFHKDVHK